MPDETSTVSSPKSGASLMEEAFAMLPSRDELLGTDVAEKKESAKRESNAPEESSKEGQEEGPIISGKETPEDKQQQMIADAALERGWKPQEEYSGKPEYWRTAREFMDRTHMMDKIKEQKEELRTVHKQQNEILKLMRQREQSFAEDRAYKLKQLKEDALAEGNVDAAYDYEKKYQKDMEQAEEYKKRQLQEQQSSDLPQETTAFVERNKNWFNMDTPQNCAMREYAIRMENRLLAQYPNWDLNQRFAKVEEEVKNLFYDRFENPRAKKATSVESKTLHAPHSKNEITYEDLPPDAKQIVNGLMNHTKNSKMTRDDYAMQLLKTGAIKYE